MISQETVFVSHREELSVPAALRRHLMLHHESPRVFKEQLDQLDTTDRIWFMEQMAKEFGYLFRVAL